MEEIVGLIGSIAKASEEQTIGIGQINEAFSQIDSSVQQNASSAGGLLRAVSRFQVGARQNGVCGKTGMGAIDESAHRGEKEVLDKTS